MGVDQRRRAFDAHVFTPVKALLPPDAIGFDDGSGLVGGERQRELAFALEPRVARKGIRRNSNNLRPGFNKLVAQAVERDRFGRAGLGVVFGIEIEDDFASPQGMQAYRFGRAGREREVRGRVARFELRHDIAFVTPD